MNTTDHNRTTITVGALTGRPNCPASRVRIRQYIPRLAPLGITVKDHIPVFADSCGLPSPFKIAARLPALYKTRHVDLTWISRMLVQGHLTFERFLHRPRIMDVDDAIWLNWPFAKWAVPHAARHMDAVIAGNNYLANYFQQYCPTVYVLPTCVDIARYHPRPTPDNEPEKFTIGWTGLASNYRFLQPLQPVLARFLTDHRRAHIALLSDKPYQHNLPPNRVTFTTWSPQNEAAALHQYSVGIMPLHDDPWSRGKCSFKMLQYMAVGLPVVVSPVGMNKEVLQKAHVGFGPSTPDDWYDALDTLYRDWNLQRQLGKKGRQIVEAFYSTDIATQELARIIKKTAAH